MKTDVSLWKLIKCFPSRLRRRNLKTQQSPVILDLRLRKTRSAKSHDYCEWCQRFFTVVKAPFSKCFPSRLKRKAVFFKFLRFEERFRKAPFSWRISVEGRPKRMNRAAFSNSSGVVWKGALMVPQKKRKKKRFVSYDGWCSSSPKVSHDWLATLWEYNRTNNRNNAPIPNTIAAATMIKQKQLWTAATLLVMTREPEMEKKLRTVQKKKICQLWRVNRKWRRGCEQHKLDKKMTLRKTRLIM